MGIIMRNGIPYVGGSGGDDAFRYVNDVNDENFGWIQYQLEDSTWVNYEQVVITRVDLFVDGSNHANFVAYSGKLSTESSNLSTPTISTSAGLYGWIQSNYGYSAQTGSIISDPYDVTSNSKLIVTYTCKHTDNSSTTTDYGKVYVYLTNAKSESMVSAALVNLMTNSDTSGSGGSTSGTAELDISNLSGEYYVVIGIYAWGNSRTEVTISDLHFE